MHVRPTHSNVKDKHSRPRMVKPLSPAIVGATGLTTVLLQQPREARGSLDCLQEPQMRIRRPKTLNSDALQLQRGSTLEGPPQQSQGC